MKKARQSKLQLFITLIITGFLAVPTAAQTTAFNYQGKLTDAGGVTNFSFLSAWIVTSANLSGQNFNKILS